VDELIARNANVNKTNDDGFPPIFYAAQRTLVDICASLLRAGADPSVQGKDPCYPDAPAMCAVDHVVDSEELRALFSTHEKCTQPAEEMIVENVKLTVDGEFSFNVLEIAEVSALPIRSWRLEFFSAGDEDRAGKKCAECVVSTFELDTSSRTGEGRVTCKPAPSCLKTIVLVADKTGEVTVEVQAVNVVGKNSPSTAVPVDMSDIFTGL
jgi:hypothetical protein